MTPSAANDLQRIYAYIAEELFDEDAALHLMREIEQRTLLLESFPYAHELCDVPMLSKYRKLIANGYVGLYTIDDENMVVTIARFFHGRQNWMEDMMGR